MSNLCSSPSYGFRRRWCHAYALFFPSKLEHSGANLIFFSKNSKFKILLISYKVFHQFWSIWRKVEFWTFRIISTTLPQCTSSSAPTQLASAAVAHTSLGMMHENLAKFLQNFASLMTANEAFRRRRTTKFFAKRFKTFLTYYVTLNQHINGSELKSKLRIECNMLEQTNWFSVS